MKRHLYPIDWDAISKRIRAREVNACKWCGIENRTLATSTRTGKPYRIVLTVAHLNHDPADCHDENLVALCQPCHLRYDAAHHAENARRTQQHKRDAALAAQHAACDVAGPPLIE